jgi:hypothetical protein
VLRVPELAHERFEFRHGAHLFVVLRRAARLDFARGVCELAGESLEFKLAEKFISRRAVGRPAAELVEVELDVNVRPDRRQIFRLEDQLGVVAQRFTVGLVLDLLPALERRLDGAELLDDLHRALRADAGRAGDVIHRVAHQPQEVNDLRGRHAEARLDPRLVAPLDGRHGLFALHVLRVLPHADDPRVADELRHVLVVRDDDGLKSRLGGLHGERADHVVGLEAGRVQDRHVVRLADADDVWNLRFEFFRRRGAVGLVADVHLVTKRRLARLEDRRDVVRLLVGEELPQHAGEDEDGLRHLPPAVRQRLCARAHRREEGAEDVRERVDQKDPLGRLLRRRFFRRHVASMISNASAGDK